MTHTAVTVKRAKAERVQGVRAVKERPQEELGKPPHPLENPTYPSHPSPAKASLIIYPHPHAPTSVPELTLSHKNKSPSSLPFVQTSPQPWAYSAQHWCCSFPHQIGGLCKEGVDGGRVSILPVPWSPPNTHSYNSLAHRGQGPPQLPP